MKYVSDDGKVTGTLEEVKKYETEQAEVLKEEAEARKRAEEEAEKTKKKRESVWNSIQKTTVQLNELIDEYNALCGANSVYFTEKRNGHLNPVKGTRDMISPLEKLIFDLF